MHKLFRYRAALAIPAVATLVALCAGQAWADEAPPVPASVVKTQTDQAHQAGMKHGKRQMHDQMMHDHQMGMSASGGTQMEGGGQAGCKDSMPMAPQSKPAQEPSSADKPAMPAMPMGDHM